MRALTVVVRVIAEAMCAAPATARGRPARKPSPRSLHSGAGHVSGLAIRSIHRHLRVIGVVCAVFWLILAARAAFAQHPQPFHSWGKPHKPDFGSKSASITRSTRADNPHERGDGPRGAPQTREMP
jgi:hypothetical protein